MTLLKELGEDRLIEELARRFGPKGPRLIEPIGDDTCVARPGKDKVLLATTDVLIEGTHFRRSYTPARLLGRKSVNVSISDIAAMGGDPFFFLVSLALPPDTEKSFIDELYKGISEAAEEHGAMLAGGNTARMSGKVTVGTTLVGEARKDKVVTRKGARAGDLIYVTGTLGDSALGLTALKRYRKRAYSRGPFKAAARRHLDPTPRLRAGKALAGRAVATAMIDLSDGLAKDLSHLCEKSKVGAEVSLSELPLSRDMDRYSKQRSRRAALKLAAAGGEDYELLFTAREADRGKVRKLSRELDLDITPIGRITKSGPILIKDEKGRPFNAGPGFEHF